MHDPFWSPRLEINASRAIFHQWEQLEASGCIDNFRIAAGEKDALREGFYFADSDAYKWLDAASRIYQAKPDPALHQLMEELIALLERAQSPDGYLFTYNQIHFPQARWVNLMVEHELYCHGHLIEAGVSHFLATSQPNLLTIARKAADRIVADFVGKGPEYTSGHEEIEIALLRLYRITAHPEYLAMAAQFIEQRGRNSRLGFFFSMLKQLRSVANRFSSIRKQRQNYLTMHPSYVPIALPPGNIDQSTFKSYLRWLTSALTGKYNQQHAPVRDQDVPVGHSVRFGYLQTSIAMLCHTTGDESLLPAMEKAWERMVGRRMFVTGGIGAVPKLEGFGNDYELDPLSAYAETCAAIACLFWNWELALLTSKPQYSDLFEWQLYNAASVGMGLNGCNYLYNNPLACKGGVTRQSWYSCPCCPSNLSRTWADLARYIYSQDDEGIWIHQYIGNQADFSHGTQVHIDMDSGLPWNGQIQIKINPEVPTKFTLHLRLPSWFSLLDSETALLVNGKPEALQDDAFSPSPQAVRTGLRLLDPHRSRFLSIQRDWQPGDVVELDFEMRINLLQAHPKVRGHTGKVAVSRGPLVYCLESIDNPGVDLFSVRLDPKSLQAEFIPELFGGCTALTGKSMDGSPLTLIPYHLWANRGVSQMSVWINR